MMIVLLSIFLVSEGGMAQSTIDSVLSLVEQNNTNLEAARKSTDAAMIGNKTGLFPKNPEAGYHYLWGKPDAMGERTDISITQEFDFPTAYLYRSQLSRLKNDQISMMYQQERYDILLQAKLLCIDIIHYNAMLAEYDKRLDRLEKVAAAYEEAYTSGERSVLDRNKIILRKLRLSKEIERVQIERTALFRQLQGLNGGEAIAIRDTLLPLEALESDFNSWFEEARQKNPQLNWYEIEQAAAEKQKAVLRAESFPGFSAGYMSEKVMDEKFSGVALGISIPLWGKANTVKHASAMAEAAGSRQLDATLKYRTRMRALFEKALSLRESLGSFRETLQEHRNDRLLKKALDEGEISVSEYSFEMASYYESYDAMLEMQRELSRTMAKLKVFEL